MTLDNVLTLAGALIPVFSALASFVNHLVRTKQAAGEPVPSMLLGAGAILNVAAVNVDKAVQLTKAMKGVAAAPVAPTEPAPEAVKVE